MLQSFAAQYLAGSNAQHFNVVVRKPTVAALIVPSLLLVIVRRTVDLDRKPRGGTIEIENVGPDRMLPPEP